MRLCNVCQQRPVAESLMRLRGLVRCHHCHHAQNKVARRAKWDSGFRPRCRKCQVRPANEIRYVQSGRVICCHCEYIATPNGLVRSQRGRSYVRDYKKSHPCVDCGESDWRCLDLDHVRGEKQFTLADACQRSIETIEREIAKCEVRCANCHRKRHYGTES